MDERERDEWREADRLFERLIELDDADPDRMADQLVAVVWLGADALLRGAAWPG